MGGERCGQCAGAVRAPERTAPAPLCLGDLPRRTEIVTAWRLRLIASGR